ncbi:MAG TPA: tetratricopeptide repeat protein [Polyangia bacterium]|nr:tetratricopeptide repeat protein [Polyangia bacterium]
MTRRRGREPTRPEIFFDHFRGALARLPAGLIRVMPPASGDELAGAAAAVGRALPDVYTAFLQSFDGADLFHETVLIAGLGPTAALRLTELPQDRADELVFAVGAAGERYALDGEGRVVRTDAGADERALAGSSFARWLDATVAREQVLYGPDGEYAPDVFDPSGEEVTPLVALRQAERALKQDPGAAGAAHARGLALRRLGRGAAAVQAFTEATALDPENPWPWFDLGRAALDDGQNARAVEAFARAAELDAGPEGGRLLAWAARAARAAGAGAEADRLRAAALGRDAGLVESLRRAVDAAAADQDLEAEAEAAALLAAIAPGQTVVARRRLPIVTELAAPPPPPARPRRPRPAAPPRSGGPRRGS